MLNRILIVGAGIYGATLARTLTEGGKRVTVIDQNSFIGGNCHTELVEGIMVHKHGPHIFHTSNTEVWNFVNKYAEFNNFVNRPKVNYKGHLYSFPINLTTLHQVFGVFTPQEAEDWLQAMRHKIPDPKNLEEFALSQIGQQLYDIFIFGYTTKQWGKLPSQLPADIIKRLPIRLNHNDNYFNDRYQGIPIAGYTDMITNMLLGIPVELQTSFYGMDVSKFDHIFYTGQIDKFFDYELGRLDYRSLRFANTIYEGIKDYQGNAVINYTDVDVPYTRVVEHKHFMPETVDKTDLTVVTREYPAKFEDGKTPYYPIRDDANTKLFNEYVQHAKEVVPNITFCGRLGSFVYIDMHQAVASAMALSKKILKGDK